MSDAPAAKRPPRQSRTGLTSTGARKAGAKSTRSRAREFALQGLYQHLVGGNDATAIDLFTRDLSGFHKADDPPPKLVALLESTFRSSGGDLPSVYRALIGSDEAWRAPATKVRSPQEFLIASYRALGRQPDFGQINGPLTAMGQPFWQPSGPNGYADTNAAWASAEGIKTRIDVAAGWGRQVANAVPDPRRLSEETLGPVLSPETRQAVARAETKPQAIALLLMSPEFQRR